MLHGTWQVTGGGGNGGRLVLIVIGAVVLFGSGAAASIASAIAAAFIAVAVMVVLAVAGLAGYLVYRARHKRVVIPAARYAPPVVHQVPAPERAALEPPRELHLHFHGHDPEQVAEILRSHQRPEP